jgi:hypothetical protein
MVPIGKMYSTGHFFPVAKIPALVKSNENDVPGAEMGEMVFCGSIKDVVDDKIWVDQKVLSNGGRIISPVTQGSFGR